MKRLFSWLSHFWYDTPEREIHVNEVVIEPLRPIIKPDLIDIREYPIVLPPNFDPESPDGWDLMLKTLSKQKWLRYETVSGVGVTSTVSNRISTMTVLKINTIALGNNKRDQEEVNHAVLHDIRRPVVEGQFYHEVYRIFSVYMRPIHCKPSVITLLCIRKYRADEALLYQGGDKLRSFKWLPKEIVAVIGKYLWSTRHERCWDK